jgi:acyl dehydratase
MTAPNRYIEDLEVGEIWVSEPVTLSADEIVQFGRLYDPQPMHIDAAEAVQGPFGGLIASGWHLTALAMRLNVQARSYGGTPIVGAGVDELRWLKPVRPGDTLTLERVLVHVEAPATERGRGTVRSRMSLRNQHGDTVMSMVAITKIPRRPR